jgi:hypothetical protein
MNRREAVNKQSTWCLPLQAGFRHDYSSTLKMEAKYSSETSVEIQQTARPYIPEYRAFTTTDVRTSDPTLELVACASVHLGRVSSGLFWHLREMQH